MILLNEFHKHANGDGTLLFYIHIYEGMHTHEVGGKKAREGKARKASKSVIWKQWSMKEEHSMKQELYVYSLWQQDTSHT